jgi:leader peptidase (prepilin peptidase) / N-methyltransferase
MPGPAPDWAGWPVATASAADTLAGSDRIRLGAPLVLSAAAFAGLAFASYPLGPGALIAAFLAAVLVTIAVIDFQTRRIPNRVVVPSIAIVLIADLACFPGRTPELLLAALVAGGLLLIPNLISTSWMGMGDVKLAVLLGLVLGWTVIDALLIAFIAVLPVTLVMMIRGGAAARKAALPFGPFIAFGALAVLIIPGLGR